MKLQTCMIFIEESYFLLHKISEEVIPEPNV